jgi:hypothetical protein
MNINEPEEFAPGETIEWRKSLTDYSPADGWALTYYFRNSTGTGFDATGTADGASWEVSAGVPSNVAAGRIDWEAWVKQGGDERLVGKGTATVLPSLKGVAAGEEFDGRTQAEKDLDAVRAALVPATHASVQEYEIGGVGSNHRVRHYDKSQLIELEKVLAQRVNSESRAAARRKGAPYFKTIYPR